jgi:DNA-nicking Smr family endonuclease
MTSSSHHGARRRGRQLDPEERRLWKQVARSVKPLRAVAAEPPEENAAPPPLPSAGRKAEAVIVAPPAPKPRVAPPPLAPLPRRERQRLARGVADIDTRIDLHGLTQAQAHTALKRFLRRAQADGAKFALVITGKGARFAAGDGERGLLKRQVPLWLRLPEFRDLIVGFDDAHAAHGGEGALYVRLRRAKN